MKRLLNRTITKINISKDKITFTCSDRTKYKLYHIQDCCESVNIEDIEGDLTDLLNTPILQSEEVTNDSFVKSFEFDYEPESYTWTFYKLATVKGYVTIRWLGISNGYYSESVSFKEI